MPITFDPSNDPATYAVSLNGDILTINGVAYDLGALAEGEALPADAIACPGFLGATRGELGVLQVTVAQGVGLLPPVAPPPGVTWARAETAATRAAARRAAMSVPVLDFIERCVEAGHMTLSEGTALARKTGLPTWATTALQQLYPQTAARTRAELRIWAADRLTRASPFVAAMQRAKSLTDAQIDALFP